MSAPVACRYVKHPRKLPDRQPSRWSLSILSHSARAQLPHHGGQTAERDQIRVVENGLNGVADSHYECSCQASDENLEQSHPCLSQEHSPSDPPNNIGGSRLSLSRSRDLHLNLVFSFQRGGRLALVSGSSEHLS